MIAYALNYLIEYEGEIRKVYTVIEDKSKSDARRHYRNFCPVIMENSEEQAKVKCTLVSIVEITEGIWSVIDV